MSFFGKLKERLFKSSSRLSEGLDDIVTAPLADTTADTPRPGLMARLTGDARRLVDDEMLENLEDLLIRADMGVETAARVTANIAEGRFGRRIGTAELRAALSGEIARILDPVARPLPL